MTDETELPAHSIYSPSGSKRWIHCPASIQMQVDIPESTGYNFPAEEGTAAHQMAEFALRNERTASSYEGDVFNGIEVDRDMANQVQKYLDYVDGLVTWQNTLIIEHRVSLEHLEPGMFGTADVVVHDVDELEVVDLKFGRGVVVEPDDNTQLMLYACGVVMELRKTGVLYPADMMVKLTIVQPRAPHRDGPIRSTFISIGALHEFERIVTRAILLSKEENPPFGPSDDSCRWCKAAPICQPFAKLQLKAMQLEFEEFKKPKREFGQSLKDVNSISIAEISSILDHSKAITHWLKTLADYAVQQMSIGKPVPNYKLVYGRSIRRWSDESKALQILVEEGVSVENLYNTKFKTAPQMEKALTDIQWNKVIDLVDKPKGKITLAPITDGRASIDPNQDAVDDWNDD